MKRVGYFSRTRYWQVYAFNHPPEGYEYKRAIDLPFKKLGLKHPFLKQTKFVAPFQKINFFHTYNAIVAGNRPWIVEVETTVPRYDTLQEGNKLFDWGINKLRSNYCKGIIFTSECTQKLNLENFERWGIDPEKCHVVYRAVEPYEPLSRAGEEKQFTILFVGNGFYRKGGYELLRAFKNFNKKDARLIIVSTLDVDWKVYPNEEEINFVNDEIQNNSKIELYDSLPHQKVIELMRKSDVFVNTTYADTFNNAILEAMSCGLPVIVTDLRAIPEFVVEGFNGSMVTAEPSDKEKVITHILDNLEKYYDNPAMLSEHKMNSKKIIEDKFLISSRNLKLEKIYSKV